MDIWSEKYRSGIPCGISLILSWGKRRMNDREMHKESWGRVVFWSSLRLYGKSSMAGLNHQLLLWTKYVFFGHLMASNIFPFFLLSCFSLWIPNSFFDTNLREAIHSQQLVYPTKICFSFTSHRRPEVALVRRDPLIDWGEDDRGLWVGRCHLFGPQRALGEGTPISRLWRNRFFPKSNKSHQRQLTQELQLTLILSHFVMVVPPWTTWLHLLSKIFLINLFR